LPPRREMVNWLGSLPSFRSMSGSRRRRALMNQLHIWKEQETDQLTPSKTTVKHPRFRLQQPSPQRFLWE
jgi:hypothetical protein